MNEEEHLKISAAILEVLAENKCSLADASLIFRTIEGKYRISAQLHSKDFLEEITRDRHERRLP